VSNTPPTQKAVVLRAALLSFCALVVAIASGQDASRVLPGTGSLSGRVVDGDSQRPLPQVMLTLTPAADGKRTLKTLTDANGEYLFDAIAGDSYRLSASLDGYVTYASGLTGIRLLSEVVQVAPGRLTRGIDFVLRRAGVIEGVITTADGKPAAGAMVSAALMLDDGNLVMTAQTIGKTNERGAYAINDVPAGSYRISVRWLDPAMPKGIGLRPTLYPGTLNAADAVAISVTGGQTTSHINVQLLTTDVFQIAGQFLRGNSEGRIESNIVAGGQSVRTVAVADDGAFDVTHLTPGRYILWARAPTADGTEAAVMNVDLWTNLTGLTMPLTPTGEVSGRVMTIDGSPLPGQLQVAAIQASDGKQIDPLERDRADVADDGGFVLRGVFGERILRVIGLGHAWELDRVMRGKSALPSVVIDSGVNIQGVTIVIRRR
jgi:hypothetical protein